MNPLFAAVLATGPAEVMAQESSTGMFQALVTRGLPIQYVTNQGFHGVRARGWPPMTWVMNGSVRNDPGNIFTTNNNISMMQIVLLPAVSTPTGGVCFGIGANRGNGFMAHRNGSATWTILFQNIRWAGTGIPIGGGLWDPKVVIWTRESNNWYININGIKSAAFASDTPTALNSAEYCAVYSENNEVVYCPMGVWWNRVLTDSDVVAINKAARRTFRVGGALAA